MEQAAVAGVEYCNDQDRESNILAAIGSPALGDPDTFGMPEIAFELQENIIQTAACVKMLLNSLTDHPALSSDKVELMNIYMKVLIHDIRSLVTRIKQNSPI